MTDTERERETCSLEEVDQSKESSNINFKSYYEQFVHAEISLLDLQSQVDD